MNATELLNPKPTSKDLGSALLIAAAVAETIREVGEVPSGTLYAMLLGRVDLQGYNKMIGALKGAGLVEETASHLLRWIGPKLEVIP